MDRNLKKEDINAISGVKEIDIFRILGAFLRHIWIIALVAVLCAAIAFAYAYFFITPTYQSSTMLYVNNGSLSIGKPLCMTSSTRCSITFFG